MKAASPDGLGPHAVLLVAAAELPFQQATAYVRSKGCIVAIGLPAKAQLKAPVFDTVVRMVTIKGSYVGNRLDAKEAVDFFTRGKIKVPYKTVELSELGNVFSLMSKLFASSISSSFYFFICESALLSLFLSCTKLYDVVRC